MQPKRLRCFQILLFSGILLSRFSEGQTIPATDLIQSESGSFIFACSSDRDAKAGDFLNTRIYKANTATQTFVALTQSTGSDAETAPSFDGNKEKMVFMAFRKEENADVYIANADGTSQKRLTFNSGWDGVPSLSRNGELIAFASKTQTGHNISLMKSDGSDLHILTPDTLYASYPSFSPDGKKIVFSGYYWKDAPGRNPAFNVFICDLDGKNQRNLGAGNQPSFSKDGQRIVFVREGLCIMNADGSDQKRITNSYAYNSHPEFSYDDRWIIFSSVSKRRSARGVSLIKEDKRDIYVIDPQGTNLQRLTHGTASYDLPAWIPMPPAPAK